MSFEMNRVELIGRLGADVTMNHLMSGRRVANLSIGRVGAGAPMVGSGGCSVAFAPGLSPAPVTAFPDPRSSNRTCGFPASGFRTRSCLRARKAHGLPRQTQEVIVIV